MRRPKAPLPGKAKRPPNPSRRNALPPRRSVSSPSSAREFPIALRRAEPGETGAVAALAGFILAAADLTQAEAGAAKNAAYGHAPFDRAGASRDISILRRLWLLSTRSLEWGLNR